MTETEPVSLDAIEEIDEDPPPEETTEPAPDESPVEPEPDRAPKPTPPTMGVVTTAPPDLEMGFREPYIAFDSTPTEPPAEPPDLEAIKAYFAELRDKLTLQIAEIESQLGFITEANDLAVRVSKIERFLGIQG